MIKKISYPLMVFSILLTACSSEDFTIHQGNISSQVNDTTPVISNVETNFPKKDGWYVVPKNSGELDVSVNATNVETILFWAVPTGTEAWGERELIGYDINGEDGWSLTWKISEISLHHRIAIQALGSDGKTITDETIQITNE
ncbi:hypothetical protein H1230_08320 [Paenibacillus sp. 19GGS1-52]|uniref:hypothetical protein n=1 Tax=Paenibacillus sp. 19GGS1-52 TaxID=2758563 RepID=UPI001EFBA763|nr:hypothetical protein [Paenibacillus sp. 19GGS1-52]ULO08772.1 hypothetical protein H1230_08320 [Paenibacillus sp. 19GGS1-52]